MFRILVFYGFSIIPYSTIKSTTKFYLLKNKTKFKKNKLNFRNKNVEFITLYGEILKPLHNSFYVGSFRMRINNIFYQIQLSRFCLELIRSFLVLKRKKINKKSLNWFFKSRKDYFPRLKIFLPNKKNFDFLLFQGFLRNINRTFYLDKKIKIIIKRKNFLKRITAFFSKHIYINKKFNKNKLTGKFLNPTRNLRKKILYHKIILLKMVRRIYLHILFFFTDFFNFFVLFGILGRFKQHSFYLSNIQDKFKTKNRSFPKNLTNQKTKFSNKLKKVNLYGHSVLKNLNFQAKQIKNLSKSLDDIYENMLIRKAKSSKTFDINFFEKTSIKYDNFLFKRLKIEKDRVCIEEIIIQLDKKKNDIIFLAIQKINPSFGVILKSMLPFHEAKITVKKNVLGKINGINFCIFSLNVRKNLNELSGGQRSILSLCFIFSLLIFRTSPFYILDEVDAALDFCYTKNISQMMVKTFSFAQFIIISHKEQIISDAEVIFEIGNMSSRSVVTRFDRRARK